MKHSLVATFLVLTVIGGCNSRQESSTEQEAAGGDVVNSSLTQTDCQPLKAGKNETTYKPAFEGQTRVCGVASNQAVNVVVLTKELDRPWAVEPLPDGALLVTEKGGRMRIVAADGKVGPAISGVPRVKDDGQGGLLDVALSPNFASDRTIFWSFTEPRQGGSGTSVARGVLSADRKRLENVQVILHTRPTFDNGLHFGSRLVFDRNGMLFVTMGERSDKKTRGQAQELGSHYGKTLRITRDGKPAPGNPFPNQEGALPEIWSYGHRNIQAATLDPQGRLWTIEHGPRGGDELNQPQAGKNYGWPVITYGIEYSGPAIGEGITQKAGLEQPVYYWDPVIAPSGAQYYTGNAYPKWRNSLFVGALREQRLVRLVIQNGRVVGEEHLFMDRQQRIRDVRQGPDGKLYVVTDGGELWRLDARA